MTRKQKVDSVPETIGEIVDEMWKQREESRKLDAQKALISEHIGMLEEILTERMKGEKIEYARGTQASVTLKPKTKFIVQDWTKFRPWMQKKGAWHLLQNRVSPKAMEEAWGQQRSNRPIPGVEKVEEDSIELRTV